MRECKVWEWKDGLSLWCFTPGLFRLFPKNCRALSSGIRARLQYAYRLLDGYCVYVLRKEDECIGYAVLRNGPIRRYPFVGKGDALLAPYWIAEKYRRQGLAYRMLDTLRKDPNLPFCTIYACVLTDNLASIRTLRKVGATLVGYLDKREASVKRLTQQQTNCTIWKTECGGDENDVGIV